MRGEGTAEEILLFFGNAYRLFVDDDRGRADYSWQWFLCDLFNQQLQ